MDTLNNIIINDIEYDITSYSTEQTKNKYILSFGDQLSNYSSNIRYHYHNVDGFFIEVNGNENDSSVYSIEIYDNNNLVYSDSINLNTWIKLNKQYYGNYYFLIKKDGNIIHSEELTLQNKRVFISFESKSLGDNIAWIPYCEEFRKKHNCQLIVSTFWNKFFIEPYPNIEFVEPGTVVNNIFALYRIGWFWNNYKEPEKPNLIPLQKSATNILGLDFKELKPSIYYIPKKVYDFKYITIATHSTAGCKYWHYPNGWQQIVDYLNYKGYKVVHVSKENTDLENVIQIEDSSIENTMSVIHNSEFFIGLSSGLSWLSWALNKHVIMISNFTSPDHEFTSNCSRITNPDVCNGCWNNPMFMFDKSDWYWCPEYKNTSRHFECHKTITPEMVIESIDNLL